LGLHGLV